MNLSRRNVVIGVGAVAAGAGAITASGAFDSVEANRSFEVSVAGDAGALLALEATNDTIAGTESGGAGGNDIIYFELDASQTGGDDAVNEDAVTRFNDTMQVTNNGTQTVQLSTALPSGLSGVAFTLADERGDADPTDLTAESYELSSGASVSLDLRIDTTTDGGYVEPSGSEPYQITIQAVTA